MTTEEIQEILRLHKLYLVGVDGGTRADFTGADLEGVNLQGENLADVILEGANLEGANLVGASLVNTNFTNANLSEADLSLAEVIGTNLTNANMSKVVLLKTVLAGVIGKEIVTFQAGQHLLTYIDGMIQLGCMENTLQYWVVNGKSIGRANGYTEAQVTAYDDFIQGLANG